MAEPDPPRPSTGADHPADAIGTDPDAVEGRHAGDAPADDATREIPVEQRSDAGGAAERTAPAAAHAGGAVAVPAEPQPVLEPAEESAPVAPKRHGNRLAGTAWVLLAAGVFELLFFLLIAALIAAVAAPQVPGPQLGQVVGRQVAQYAATPFAWLPVLFFFLFFELTVLLFNRAGRFLYVAASLVVGLLTYLVSVLLISVLVRGSIGDASTLAQTFLIPQFVLVGLVAREVMLWTGIAIGARGTRVRRRDRAEQQAYRRQLAEG